MAESVRASWAAAAILVGLLYVSDGATTAAATPRAIAASGTTIVDRIIPSLIANATQQLAPGHANLTITYEAVDSPTDVRNWLQGADDFAVTYIAVSSQQEQQANRVILQIPWAVANTAVVYNLPGTPEDSLRLSAKVLSGIYSCSITSWQDPAILALNPNITVPNLKIIPASYSESKGTTAVFSRYLATAPGWTLGSAAQLPWPRCVQHVRTPDGIDSAVARAPGAIAWTADWRINATSPAQLYTANLQNAAGNFIPSNATYSLASLAVPAVSSPNWINITFATSTQPDIYPMGNFLFNVLGQDLSASGVGQASAVQDLMGYFLSDAVQQNLTGYTFMPVPPALVAAGRQAVASMTINQTATQTRGGQAAVPAASDAGADGLVSGGVVVEGSGGASMQNLVKSVLLNATATGRFSNAGLTFAPTDSDQGKQGVITQSFAYAMSTLALTQAELTAANRPMVQVPLGYSPLAILHSLPGVPNGVLNITAPILAAIYQCQVTSWNDVSISAANPGLTLPNQPILPLGLSDASGTTSLFATYASRSPDWKLGVQTSLPWPRCIRRTIGGSNAIVSTINGSSYYIGYAALAAVMNSSSNAFSAAAIQNRGGVFVSPYNSVFPFYLNELPPSIASPAWQNLSLVATVVHIDRYAIGGLIYIIASQDLSTLGFPQSVVLQQLMQYWLSDAVQSNMSHWGAAPLLPAFLQVARQQVAALNTQPGAPGQAPGLAPAPGVAVAGSASSAPYSQQGSSKAGIPWWGGLIIGLVALALIGALAGLAAFFMLRRRRARRGSALEEAVHKQEPSMAERDGLYDGRTPDGEPGVPKPPGTGSKGSRVNENLSKSSSTGSGTFRASSESARIIAMEHADGVDDERMPLGLRGASVRSVQSSGGTQQGSLNGLSRDRRRSSSYGRDNWGTDQSKGSWGAASRGASLNNEAAYASLPDILRSRAENVDVEDIERGSLLGRGSFGKVYQGWWRGGVVAIKVVPHDGDLGEKVEIVRESLLSSAIQHPQIVTTYKAITVGHGAHQDMKRGESIPEGSAVASRGSGRNASGRGSGSSGTNRSAGPRDDLMETWIIMEYCDLGSLDCAISDGRFADLEHLLLRLLDVAMGMDYLHKLGILHTDLKPSNVLLKTAAKQANDPTGCTCKLADFGLSRVMETNATHISTNTIGTIAYQPEEVLKEGKVTPASDVYSFAILMYELYTCKHLFKGMMHSQMFFKVFNGYRPPLPDSMPAGMQKLMEACWSHNPAERPSFRFIVRALQRLIIEQRRARSSGRMASMNLDDALAGAEMAQQYPVGPSMPIQAPSDSQQPSSPSSGSGSRPRTTSGSQNRSSNQRQSPATDFEMALLDLRKKALAGQLGSQPQLEPPQQSAQQPERSGSEGRPRQGLEGDGPETPPKLNSTGSPPPEQVVAASSAAAAAEAPQAASQAPAGAAGSTGAAGSLGVAGSSSAATHVAEPAVAASESPQPLAKPSPFAAQSMSPPPADDWGSGGGRRSSFPTKIKKANRYDMLLGD